MENSCIYGKGRGGNCRGFTLNRFWPVPFIIFVNGQIIYPATIVAILGYGDYALANYPEKKSRETAGILSIFSIILIIFAKLSMNYEIFKYIGAIFSPLGHEIVIKIGQKREENGKYLFKPSPQGLKILDVLPGGIGKKIEFRIRRYNSFFKWKQNILRQRCRSNSKL